MNEARRKQLRALEDRLEKEVSTLAAQLHAALEEIAGKFSDIKEEEEEAHGNLPDALQEGEKGQAMQESISALEDLDGMLIEHVDALETLKDGITELVTKSDEAKGQS